MFFIIIQKRHQSIWRSGRRQMTFSPFLQKQESHMIPFSTLLILIISHLRFAFSYTLLDFQDQHPILFLKPIGKIVGRKYDVLSTISSGI